MGGLISLYDNVGEQGNTSSCGIKSGTSWVACTLYTIYDVVGSSLNDVMVHMGESEGSIPLYALSNVEYLKMLGPIMM